jgi:hypothetical protein
MVGHSENAREAEGSVLGSRRHVNLTCNGLIASLDVLKPDTEGVFRTFGGGVTESAGIRRLWRVILSDATVESHCGRTFGVLGA